LEEIVSDLLGGMALTARIISCSMSVSCESNAADGVAMVPTAGADVAPSDPACAPLPA
jgi:hypothetical protein